ncbi:unnamed protein product [Lota lota]
MTRLSVLRHACRSLRISPSQQCRSGATVLGFAKRCPPVGLAGNRDVLRGARTTSTSASSMANKYNEEQKEAAIGYEKCVSDAAESARESLVALQRNDPALHPVLAIVQRGEDDGLLEVNRKMAGKIGLNITQICLTKDCTEDEIVDEVSKLSKDPRVHGVYLHLTPSLLTGRVLSALAPEKDVDGVVDLNMGRLVRGDVSEGFVPAAARAVMEVLERHGQGIRGVSVLVLNAYVATQNVVLGSCRWLQGQQYQAWSLRSLKLQPLTPVPSDIQISRAQAPKSVQQLAQEIGLLPSELEPYGRNKAKVRLSLLDRLHAQPDGNLVLVAGITPTPLGEGKSTVTIGLVQALSAHLKLNSFACLRQPSQGPTFGVKVVSLLHSFSCVPRRSCRGRLCPGHPMEEFNLHLTGDIHAITATNNLVAAAIDARMLHEATQSDKALYNRLVPLREWRPAILPHPDLQAAPAGPQQTDPGSLTAEEVRSFVRLDLDPSRLTWQRVVDTNDRFLRKITVGQASTEKGHTRETGFDIAVASEIMAILALADGLEDMKVRLARMVVGTSRSGQPVTAEDLGVSGALAVLMKDAIKPTLMQTLEGPARNLPMPGLRRGAACVDVHGARRGEKTPAAQISAGKRCERRRLFNSRMMDGRRSISRVERRWSHMLGAGGAVTSYPARLKGSLWRLVFGGQEVAVPEELLWLTDQHGGSAGL